MNSASAKEKERTLLGRAVKRIEVRRQNERGAEDIASRFSLSPVAARVLAARGFQCSDDEAEKEIGNFLRPTFAHGIPHPREAKNLLDAAQAIAQAVIKKEKIALCCDFDVDGLSGGSQAYHFLQSAGAEIDIFVPNRFTEGYGLNEAMVKKIANDGFSWMVTIDFGTSNFREMQLAKDLGLRVAVFDHHHVGERIPPADFFVNPQQEGCGFAGRSLCAAGLVWFLLVALKSFLPSAKDIDPKEYLDLACLGTICDMVPLTGVNRILARRGLEMLARTKRRGLVALKDVVGVKGKLTSSHVSFGIGPRLNAAGRLVHGEMVIELLTTNAGEKAKRIASRLHKLNLERQKIEEDVKLRAIAEVSSRESLPAGLVACGDDFHTGVIGIVAQRLVEHFYRPAAVLGLDKEHYKGSVRGVRGLSVIRVLEDIQDVLVKFGGHEGAGGFSILRENRDIFRERFEKACLEHLEACEKEPIIYADTEARFSDISPQLVDELQSFEPFGTGNPQPTLLFSNLRVLDIRVMKEAHTKATFSDGKFSFSGVLWRDTKHPALVAGKRVRIAARPEKNNFLGREEIQLMLQAIEEC